MKDIWTKIITSTTALLIGLLFTGTAFATESTNSNTGADSENTASVEVENSTTINSTNNAKITNNISVSANTGDNSASENTGDGSITTGDINGSLSVQNTGNSNIISEGATTFNCEDNCNFSANNSWTGSDSDNNSSVSVTNNLDISLNNRASVNNDVDADLNTGSNFADGNTGDGTIITGNVDFDVEVVNDLNRNQIGGPAPEVPLAGPGEVPEGKLPSQPSPGQVLAAGLPITGGSLPNWPLMLLFAGFTLKVVEKYFKERSKSLI